MRIVDVIADGVRGSEAVLQTCERDITFLEIMSGEVDGAVELRSALPAALSATAVPICREGLASGSVHCNHTHSQCRIARLRVLRSRYC